MCASRYVWMGAQRVMSTWACSPPPSTTACWGILKYELHSCLHTPGAAALCIKIDRTRTMIGSSVPRATQVPRFTCRKSGAAGAQRAHAVDAWVNVWVNAWVTAWVSAWVTCVREVIWCEARRPRVQRYNGKEA